MKRIASSILKHPALWTILATLASFLSGTCAVLMADFGQPLWMFAPLLLWLGTIGLPSTLAVLLVAMCWGRFPALYGMPFFVVCAALLAATFQAVGLRYLARLIKTGTKG